MVDGEKLGWDTVLWQGGEVFTKIFSESGAFESEVVGGLFFESEEKVFGDLGSFSPDELSGGVDGCEEDDDHAIQRAAVEREEGESAADDNGEENKGPFDEVGKGHGVEEKADTNAGTKLEELLDGHVADQVEFVGGDVLGDGVLLHGISIKDLGLSKSS